MTSQNETTGSARRWSFGPATFDERTLELAVNGRVVDVERKALEVLRFLLQHGGDVVTKDQLIQAVWPGRVISDSALTSCIAKLRSALRDESQALVKTVHGYGYRLVAEVRTETVSGASLPVAVAAEPSVEAETLSSAPVLTAGKPWDDWRRPAVALGAAAVVAALAVGVFLASRSGQPGTVRGELSPVAIIPCDNLSGDAALDLFAEGIAEEVSSRLTRIRDLAVIGRTSSRAFRGKDLDAADIGKQLGAGHVLTCSIRKLTQGLRLTAQLVDTPTRVQVWVKSFDRTPDAAIDLSDDIAISVADAVLPQLVGEDRARLIRHNTDNPKALEAYHKGMRAAGMLGDIPSLEQSVPHFEEATRLDPQFALPHVGLATAFNHLGQSDLRSLEQWRERAFASSARALELDPLSGEAHAIAGVILATFRQDYLGMKRKVAEGMRLNPNSSFVNVVMAAVLSWYGGSVEAIAYAEKARRLDPIDPGTWGILVQAAGESRSFDRCTAEATRSLEQFPDLAKTFRSWRAFCLSGAGRHAEALAEVRRQFSEPPVAHDLAFLAYAQAMNGDRAEALKLIAEVRQKGEVPWVLPAAYAAVGDKDNALKALEDVFREGTDGAWCEYHRFYLDSLRSDPRFIELGRKHGMNPDGTLINPEGT